MELRTKIKEDNSKELLLQTRLISKLELKLGQQMDNNSQQVSDLNSLKSVRSKEKV